jgi:hypothetical protein
VFQPLCAEPHRTDEDAATRAPIGRTVGVAAIVAGRAPIAPAKRVPLNPPLLSPLLPMHALPLPELDLHGVNRHSAAPCFAGGSGRSTQPGFRRCSESRPSSWRGRVKLGLHVLS